MDLLKLFRKKKKEVVIESVEGVWSLDEMAIVFLESNVIIENENKVIIGKYSLFRGLIVWDILTIPIHPIFKQNVNYQVKGNTLLLTFNDQSYEFKKR